MYRVILKLKFVILFCILNLSLLYGIEKTQIIELKKGWNAVYLTVDPKIEDQNLSAYIFQDANSSAVPIEIIAAFIPSTTSAEFIKFPDEIPWKKDGWHRWVHDDKPESFLTNLYSLSAGQGYLVKSTKDYTWKVTGDVTGIKKYWKPGIFNLTGFSVGDGDISFYEYLSSSTIANSLLLAPIYTLKNNQWNKVSPVDELVEKNKAYWIFTNKGSNFQSVVEVTTSNRFLSLDFSSGSTYQTIYLKNTSSQKVTATLSLESNTLPLSLVTKNDKFENTLTTLSNTIGTFELESNEKIEIKLAIKRENMNAGKSEGIVKIAISETNEVIYLPVIGYGIE